MNNFTVLFQGDSVTDCHRNRNELYDLGLGYPRYAAELIREKYPKCNFTFINKGISGDRSSSLAQRWKKDCTDLKPDYVSILIGVNDTNQINTADYQSNIRAFESNIDYIFKETKSKLGVPVMVLSPFIVDLPEYPSPFRKMLEEEIEIERRLAKKYGYTFVELDKMFAQEAAACGPFSLAKDGFHPDEDGKKLIAKAYADAFETE